MQNALGAGGAISTTPPSDMAAMPARRLPRPRGSKQRNRRIVSRWRPSICSVVIYDRQELGAASGARPGRFEGDSSPTALPAPTTPLQQSGLRLPPRNYIFYIFQYGGTP
jgi:hypothetical protein